MGRHEKPAGTLSIRGIALFFLLSAQADAVDGPSVERGEYIYRLAGCASCHADRDGQGPVPAGNVPLDTPFGTFYTPNITPDRETGIGGWTGTEFIAAVKEGISPDGGHYFPAFPYTSYTLMQDRDLLDLKAFLDSLPPVRKPSREHDLSFPFNQRWLLGFWKALFFEQEPVQPDESRSELWNRGAYIVNGPGHCSECHTPRNLFGGLQHDEMLAGNPRGPEGGRVPGIDPGRSESFRQWSADDIVFALQTGMLPDGDFLGGSMGHVIENSTSRLSDRDIKAIAEYLQSPALTGESGLFTSLFDTTDAAAEQDGPEGEGRTARPFGGLAGFILLLLLGGIIWWLLRKRAG